MWVKEIFLGFVGLASGLAVSAGVFGFIVVLGVIPRITGRTHTSRYVMSYESAIFLGGMLGNLLSVFDISLPLGIGFVSVFGLCAGIYVGCLAIALAEMLNAFPIMFRRSSLKIGLGWVLVMVAIGKVIGSLYYFALNMTVS